MAVSLGGRLLRYKYRFAEKGKLLSWGTLAKTTLGVPVDR